jgi:hypothetical protein
MGQIISAYIALLVEPVGELSSTTRYRCDLLIDAGGAVGARLALSLTNLVLVLTNLARDGRCLA